MDVALRRLSEQRRISVNVLTNQIIMAYLETNEVLSRLRWAILPRSVFRKALDVVTKEQVMEMGKLSGEAWKEISMLLYGSFELKEFIPLLDMRSKLLPSFEYSVKETGDNKLSVIVTHDLGPNGSIYWSEVVGSALTSMGILRPTFDLTNSTISFKLPAQK